jgi:hypothetical protein
MADAFNAKQLHQFVRTCTSMLAELRSTSRPVTDTDDDFTRYLMHTGQDAGLGYHYSDVRSRLSYQHQHVDQLSRQLLQQLANMQHQLQVPQQVGSELLVGLS